MQVETTNKRVIVGNLYIYGECLETGKELNISRSQALKAMRINKVKNKVVKLAGSFDGPTFCEKTGSVLGYWQLDNRRLF